MMKSIQRTLLVFLNISFGLFFGFVFLYTCTSHAEKYVVPSIRPLRVLCVLLAALGSLVALRALSVRSKTLAQVLRQKRTLVSCGILALLFCWQIFFVWNTVTPVGWDVGAVMQTAQDGASYYYFTQYPNNVMLLIIFKAVIGVANLFHSENIWLFAAIFNVICMDIAVCLSLLLCKRWFSMTVYYTSFFLLSVTLCISPWLTIPYTDTIGLPFVVGAFYVWARLREETVLKNKILWSVLLGALLFVGGAVKPTIFILVIALCIASLLHMPCRRTSKKSTWLLTVAVVLIVMLPLQMLFSRYKYTLTPKEEWQNKAFTMTHFYMMGLQQHGIYYGNWFEEDVIFSANQPTKQARQSANLERAAQRRAELKCSGVANLYYHKLMWSVIDGTFSYATEGTFHGGEEKQADGLRGTLQNLTYAETSFYQKWYVNYAQGLWAGICLLLASTFFYCGKAKKQYSGASFIRSGMQIGIVGLLLFLTLFEPRGRYLIIFFPLFAMLAAIQFERMHTELPKYLHLLKNYCGRIAKKRSIV
ncbi:MAG: glycosyltransferase family 39 protein [Ruthenibacterium sp.]